MEVTSPKEKAPLNETSQPLTSPEETKTVLKEEPEETDKPKKKIEKPKEEIEKPLLSSPKENTESEKLVDESAIDQSPQLIDASTNAELYTLENDDRVVSIRKLEDVIREKKIVLPEAISNDWLVLNVVQREIPTF